MTYSLIQQIVSYLKNSVSTIKFIKRIESNVIMVEFNNKEFLYFDMTKSQSLIFKKREQNSVKKDYNAPFDVLLKKRFINAKIENISIYNEDNVINIKVTSPSSYKQLITILQFEFTGKHTNVIILDENRLVLEALRHIDEFSSFRIVKVGHKLEEIPKKNFNFKEEKLKDIEKYLFNVYEQKEKKNLANLKKQKLFFIEKKLQKLQKIMDTLPKKERLTKDSQELYFKANTILSNIHNIKPYQKTLNTYDYEGNKISIKLNIEMTAATFSNELFKKAKKLKQKAVNIILEKQNLEEKISFLKRMKNSINNCKSIDEIEFLLPKKEKNQTKVTKQPYKSFFYNGYKILLGRSEKENIYLLKNSKASDFWFHLKDKSSSHVIVQNTKKSIPEHIIIKASQLCANFSTNFSGKYLVDYTQRRNVKIKIGSNVLYNPYKTITVII